MPLINSKGTCKCPDCGLDGAQVGRTKNGAPYSHCDSTECEGTKWWTHGAGGKPIKGKVKKLLALLRAGKPADGVDVNAWAAECGVTLDAAPAPKPDDAPAKKPKFDPFVL